MEKYFTDLSQFLEKILVIYKSLIYDKKLSTLINIHKNQLVNKIKVIECKKKFSSYLLD